MILFTRPLNQGKVKVRGGKSEWANSDVPLTGYSMRERRRVEEEGDELPLLAPNSWVSPRRSRTIRR